MPQPVAAPATPAAKQPATPPVQHHVGSVPWLIQQAKDLEIQRGEILEKIGAVRSQLRNLKKLGALDADALKFVQVFYPEKERGETRSKEEVEKTRAAREAARKGELAI